MHQLIEVGASFFAGAMCASVYYELRLRLIRKATKDLIAKLEYISGLVRKLEIK